jgi:hypothetical protein
VDGIDGDDVGNGLRHRSFPEIAEGLPFLGKIRMSRFNQNVRCWPTELAALSNSLAVPVQQPCRFRLGQIDMLKCKLELWSLPCHGGLPSSLIHGLIGVRAD